MTTSNPATTTESFRLHPAMQMGHVHYTTASLDRQIALYRDLLGFQLHWHADGSAGLGAGGSDLLRLTEQKDARRVRGTTGLYHTAFLVPTRWELAHLLRRIHEANWPVQGMVNHHTHLAIYLPDAEGNGIELAWDFPPDRWPDLSTLISAGSLPLYAAELEAELQRDPSPWTGLDPATKVGHVHLHVSNLDVAADFYSSTVGFDMLFSNQRFQAAFFSAGGYHHHLGTNIWNGPDAPAPPENAVGLRYFSISLPGSNELARTAEHLRQQGIPTEETDHGILLRDPFSNGILLATL